MKLQNFLSSILILLLLTLSASGFLLNDDFTAGINPAAYTNVSKYNGLGIFTDSLGLHLNGTNGSTGTSNPLTYGTYLRVIDTIAPNQNGYFSQTFKLNATGGSNPRFVTYIGNTSEGISLNVEPSQFYLANTNGGARICTGAYKAFDNSSHTFFVNVTRTATNTTYAAYWDGVAWCTLSRAVNATVSAIITDYTPGTAGDGNGANHHIIYSNVQFSDYNYTTNCPAIPAYPIFAQDNFNYVGLIDSCGWFPTPITSISTFNNKLCYDATGKTELFYFWLGRQGNKYSAPVFTEEFEFSLANNSYFEKVLDFYVGDGQTRQAYVVDFYTIGGQGDVSVNYVFNGSTYSQSICSNCFDVGTTNGVVIISYGTEATGYTALNTTSNSLNPVQVNTYSVEINGISRYFNLPILAISPDGANVPSRSTFAFSGGYGCIDNYVIYSGLSKFAQLPTNITGLPYALVGEKCLQDWNCYTGYCNYIGLCQKKGFMAACSGAYECLSNKCVGGVCTKPSLVQTITTAKDDAVGTDQESGSILALILSLVIAAAIVVLGTSVKVPGSICFIAGGGIFTICLIVFTIIGWLSPFILMGYFILLAGVLFLILFPRG